MELAPIQNNKIAYLGQTPIRHLTQLSDFPELNRLPIPDLGGSLPIVPQQQTRSPFLDQQQQMFEAMASFMSSMLDRVMQMLEKVIGQIFSNGGIAPSVQSTATATNPFQGLTAAQPTSSGAQQSSTASNSFGGTIAQLGGIIQQGLGIWNKINPAVGKAIDFGEKAWDIGKSLFDGGKSLVSSGISFVKDLF